MPSCMAKAKAPSCMGKAEAPSSHVWQPRVFGFE